MIAYLILFSFFPSAVNAQDTQDTRGTTKPMVSAQVEALGVDVGYGAQWGLQFIHANEVWAISNGTGVVVAVIDSGSGPNPDLNSNILPGRSIIRGRYIESSSDVDPFGHGTHVAGIIAAQNNNDIGIAGVAPNAKILPIRILDSAGDGTESDLAIAIRYAVDQGVRVINLSLGGKIETTSLITALQYAADRNVLVVAAAGNGGPNSAVTYPAGDDLTLAVTAIDQLLNAPSFTQRGSYIDITAPGVSICSTSRDDTVVDLSRRCAGASEPYITMSGTSMAAAFVSGVAALIISAQPALTAIQVREVILATATDIGELGRDATFGAGLVNVYAIFQALGYFAAAVVFPTVSSLGQVGVESIGSLAQLPTTERLQWFRCNKPGEATLVIPEGCASIAQSQKINYTPNLNDIGFFLRFSSLVPVDGVPEIRFSATTPRVTGIWSRLTAIEIGSKISLTKLIQTPSGGTSSARKISGPCRIIKEEILVAEATGTCVLRLVVAAKKPFGRLSTLTNILILPKI
ncbi:hypothetical protein LBMAG16_02590 [Actinomycetes bacterium]|nr:hypothetical protein LBMAG16_02590 [Actinomycetes bacterium]